MSWVSKAGRSGRPCLCSRATSQAACWVMVSTRERGPVGQTIWPLTAKSGRSQVAPGPLIDADKLQDAPTLPNWKSCNRTGSMLKTFAWRILDYSYACAVITVSALTSEENMHITYVRWNKNDLFRKFEN